MQHSCMMPQSPILMTRPVKPKPKNQSGLWLDRPGHQDGALGHHPGIMQECCMIHLESFRRCMIYTNHAGHPTACLRQLRFSYSGTIPRVRGLPCRRVDCVVAPVRSCGVTKICKTSFVFRIPDPQPKDRTRRLHLMGCTRLKYVT